MQPTLASEDGLALSTLTLAVNDGVAWLTMNRPEVMNAFDDAMLADFASVWAHLRLRDEVRVVVLTGSGEKAFCTGYDRNQFDSGGELITHPSPYIRKDVGEFLGPKSAGFWKPVVAAVNGIACGGAAYLLGEADIIIAADHATFFDPHVTFGMPAVYEPLHLLRRMPLGEVLRLTLLGSAERLSAARALQIGLVSQVVPGEELHETARWIASTIAALPPLPVQASLRAIWLGTQMSLAQALGAAQSLVAAGSSDESLAEGQRTFESGARPKWRLR
jgi:enoyl-CoA hydratase/carnithine racemase